MHRMKLQVLFYQNPAKTQNRNFRSKFQFLGFLKNLFMDEVDPFPRKGHILNFDREVEGEPTLSRNIA